MRPGAAPGRRTVDARVRPQPVASIDCRDRQAPSAGSSQVLVREVQRESAPGALLRPLRGEQAGQPGHRVGAHPARHPPGGRGLDRRAAPAARGQAGGSPAGDRGRAGVRRAHLVDRGAAALGGIEEDPRLRLARGREHGSLLGRFGASADRRAARRGLSGAAHPGPVRVRGRDGARRGRAGDAGARQPARQAGAAVPERVRPRPDRARPAGPVRPAHRPRRGSRADRPDPRPAHQEQPDPARRAGSGQDRDRRGAGSAGRAGPGAALPGGEAYRSPRPVADRRRHEVPGPVRGAPEGHPQGTGGRRGHPRLHRRDPRPGRGRLGRRLARRGEHPQTGAVEGRHRLHRRHHAARVPPLHREGPLAAAALPGDPGPAADGGRDVRHPGGAQGALPGLPQGGLRRRRPAGRGRRVEPLHPRPLPAGQVDRRHGRGRRPGQAAPGEGHAADAPDRKRKSGRSWPR